VSTQHDVRSCFFLQVFLKNAKNDLLWIHPNHLKPNRSMYNTNWMWQNMIRCHSCFVGGEEQGGERRFWDLAVCEKQTAISNRSLKRLEGGNVQSERDVGALLHRFPSCQWKGRGSSPPSFPLLSALRLPPCARTHWDWCHEWMINKNYV